MDGRAVLSARTVAVRDDALRPKNVEIVDYQ